MSRPSGRQNDQMRDIQLETGVSLYAEGSCLAKFGNTHVLCTATVEEKVPHWMKGQGSGWITAEYGMLPRSTHDRMDREASRGKQSGRTQEIQRLIGRALRAAIDLKALGEIQIRVDCDVIQADGGTRTAAITGAFVALSIAIEDLMAKGSLAQNPIIEPVSAISCGLYEGQAVLDLDYVEDSNAQADANFVITASGGIVEIQGTAEDKAFTRDQFNQLLDLATKGCGQLVTLQREAIQTAEKKAA